MLCMLVMLLGVALQSFAHTRTHAPPVAVALSFGQTQPDQAAINVISEKTFTCNHYIIQALPQARAVLVQNVSSADLPKPPDLYSNLLIKIQLKRIDALERSAVINSIGFIRTISPSNADPYNLSQLIRI